MLFNEQKSYFSKWTIEGFYKFSLIEPTLPEKVIESLLSLVNLKWEKEKGEFVIDFSSVPQNAPCPHPFSFSATWSYWAHWANEFMSVGRGSWKAVVAVQCLSFTSAACLFTAHRIINRIKWNRHQHLSHPYHMPGIAVNIFTHTSYRTVT